MINNVSQISPVYTQTSTKTDNVDTLPAAEWNAISAAVAQAHTKINNIIANGTFTSTADGLITSNGSSTYNSETYPTTVAIENNNGNVSILADGNLSLEASGQYSGTGQILFSVNGHDVDVEDLYKVIEYFKTNNTTGPFASA